MSNYKNKYLRAEIRQRGGGPVVCRLDVSHLNKKGREMQWDLLDLKYPSPKYITCFESTNDDLRCF